MIILLHGDNIEASRYQLNKLISEFKGKEVRRLDGRTIDKLSLGQALMSQSLFGGESLVIIENLFGKLGKKQKLITELAATIVNSQSASDVILWENKEIGITVLKNLGGKTKVQLFKTPVIIFQFLDSLKPNNAKTLINLYGQAIAQNVPELIFTMIGRRIRQLIMVKDGTTPENLQGWQASRLTNQARLFTLDKLITMYKQLLEIEFSIKTGNTPFNLTQLTEQFLIDI